MVNDLENLYKKVIATGVQNTYQNYEAEQLIRIETLRGDAKILLQTIHKQHVTFKQGYYWYQHLPEFEKVKKIILVPDFWEQPDIDKMWKSVLPANWESDIKAAWKNMSAYEKIDFFVYFTWEWIVREVSLLHLVEYLHTMLNIGNTLSACLIEKLKANDLPYVDKVKAILRNESEIGIVDQRLVNLILKSGNERLSVELNALLLAAQRQEGLRQTIINAIGIGPISSKTMFIRTILDNELVRFSSIQRRLESWFDLPLADGKATSAKELAAFGRLILDITTKNRATTELFLSNTNLTESYFQLWVIKETSQKKFWEAAQEIMELGNSAQKALVLYCTARFNVKGFQFAKKYCKNEKDFTIRWNILLNIQNKGYNFPYEQNDGTFEFFEALFKDILTDELKNQNAKFVWEDYQFSIQDLAKQWMYIVSNTTKRYIDILPYENRLSADIRSNLLRLQFEYVNDSYCRKPGKEPIILEPTPFERDWIVKNMQDKVPYVYSFALKLFELIIPLPEELPILYKLLTRKNEQTRKPILNILGNLVEKDVKASITYLVSAKSEEQRLAGLDLLQQLKKQEKVLDFVENTAKNYTARTKIGSKAELILKDILKDGNPIFDESNGYGLYDPHALSPIPALEAPTSGFFVEKMLGQPMFGISMDKEKLHAELKKLDALIAQHANYEFEIEQYNKTKETVVLGNLRNIEPVQHNPKTRSEKLTLLPLSKVWQQWYDESGLTAMDLYILYRFNYFKSHEKQIQSPNWIAEAIEKYQHRLRTDIFSYDVLPLQYPTLIDSIIEYFSNEESLKDQIFEIGIDATLHFFSNISVEQSKDKFSDISGCYTYTWPQIFVGSMKILKSWEYGSEAKCGSKVERMPDPLFKKYWAAYYWFYRITSTLEYEGECLADLSTINRAFEMGLLTETDVHQMCLFHRYWVQLNCNLTHYNYDIPKERPIFKNFIQKAVPHLLSIELKRGESPTTVTKLAKNISKIEGIEFFVNIMKGLGNDTLERGYYSYYHRNESKKSLFSAFLKSSNPKKTETFEDFKKAIDACNLTDTRLLEFALYAPQWLPWTEQYLKWPGLLSAAWCLHAHGHNYIDLQKESEIAKFTPLSIQDYNDGSVDVTWYKEVYAKLGKKRFQAVYKAAHYISDNSGYTRSRVYADAILGKISLEDCKNRILKSRNKDFVVALGLIPLHDATKEIDILDRYKFLQSFNKSSKNFGQQRQTSEKKVVLLAMENLARNAGYPDPIRLTWAMETLEVKQLMKNTENIVIDETSVALQVSEEGKAEVVVTKKDKILASVPAALKKNEKVAAMIDLKNHLNAQQKRIKKALEEAMNRGDVFEAQELEHLLEHPIMHSLLKTLVWVGDTGVIDFYDRLPASFTYRIAHCTDLLASGRWVFFQKSVFQQKLTQPFKQVFRELYTPTQDELATGGESRRYEGYQIQPSQAAALFRARGWSANYNEGMQKVFHQEKIQVLVETYADWFSPQNSEPTELHSVHFSHKSTGEALLLKDIPKALFSEVMRDLDLVVSVAHVGGVDIEASLSSIALRAAIVAETAALFELDNVSVEKNHIFIHGSKGEYTIHLGSGVVHQKPGQMLSITSISSQARGRIFLPFVDEDPKTAEIVSKVLLLANDKEIRDAKLLGQIKR